MSRFAGLRRLGLLTLGAILAVFVGACHGEQGPPAPSGTTGEQLEGGLVIGQDVALPLVLDGDRLGISSLDGSPPAQLAAPGGYFGVRYDAAGRLVYLQWSGQEPGFYRFEDGSARLVIPLPEFERRFQAEWSPDGTMGAWIERQGGTTRLRVAQPYGAPRTIGPEGLVGFLWSPDGRSLVAWTSGSHPTTYVLDAAGAAPAAEASLTGSPVGWSSTGDVLVWEQLDGTQARRVVLVKTGGTDRRILGEVTLPYEGSAPSASFSPDGRWLAFDTATANGFSQGLLVGATDGSTVFRPHCISCAAASQGWGPVWSTDGARLAWSQDGHILVADTGVWEGRAIADGGMPMWSPDGSTIAYVRTEGDHTSVYARRLAGGPEVKVVDLQDARLLPDQAAWSPDGRRLVVPLQAPESSRALSFDLETGQLQELPLPALDPSVAVLAPDGSAVQYLLYSVPDLLLASLDGTERVIDRGPGGGVFTDWSADGQKVLVVGSQGLKSVDLATGEIDWLMKGNVQDAVWSPDGKRVAFIKDQRPGVLDVAKGEAKIIAPDLTAMYLPNQYSSGYLAWSPDGKRIAFGDWRAEEPVTQGRSDVYVVNADGSGLRRLTDSPRAKYRFAFSRDGKHLAYIHVLDDGDHLKVLQIDTGRELSMDLESWHEPRWVGADTLLVNNGRGILAVRLDGSVQVLVAATGGCRRDLIGWANEKLLFASSCTHRGL
jgi:Tol biopolymer transport system component